MQYSTKCTNAYRKYIEFTAKTFKKWKHKNNIERREMGGTGCVCVCDGSSNLTKLAIVAIYYIIVT